MAQPTLVIRMITASLGVQNGLSGVNSYRCWSAVRGLNVRCATPVAGSGGPAISRAWSWSAVGGYGGEEDAHHGGGGASGGEDRLGWAGAAPLWSPSCGTRRRGR